LSPNFSSMAASCATFTGVGSFHLDMNWKPLAPWYRSASMHRQVFIMVKASQRRKRVGSDLKHNEDEDLLAPTAVSV
jgi:hypothetical protein